jgi:hypothetical protein
MEIGWSASREAPMAETIREFLKKIENLPPDTLLCVAEVDEAFAANVADVEVVENARANNNQADGVEAVELGNGDQKVVVIRW